MRWGPPEQRRPADGHRLRRSTGARDGRAAADDPVPGYTGGGLLAGWRALVVGGVMDGRAPGRLASVALAKEGAAVAVADRTVRAVRAGARPLDDQGEDDALLATTRLLAALGARTLAIHCDLGTEAGCREAVAHTALEFGAIDTLVVCPSGAPAGPGGAPDRTDWLVWAARMFMPPDASVVVAAPPSDGRAVGPVARFPASPLAAELGERGIRVRELAPDRGDAADRAAACVALAGAQRMRA